MNCAGTMPSPSVKPDIDVISKLIVGIGIKFGSKFSVPFGRSGDMDIECSESLSGGEGERTSRAQASCSPQASCR